MAQLLVRGIDSELIQRLKMRAARHGTSAEEEHRRILFEALKTTRAPRTLKDLLLEVPDVGEDSDFERPPDRGRAVDL
jgi:plasmid stability protein